MLELARPADWEAVNRLSRQIHDLHVSWRPDIYRSSEAPMPKDFFMEAIAQRMLYVAKVNEEVVGYVHLSMEKKDYAGVVPTQQMRLGTICVEESMRGQGIGRAMLTDVRALAKAFRCREILLSVHPENDGAVAFYQKCGFFIRTIGMDMKV